MGAVSRFLLNASSMLVDHRHPGVMPLIWQDSMENPPCVQKQAALQVQVVNAIIWLSSRSGRMEIAVFAIWFLLAVFIAGAADSRGRSAFGWFVISMFLSPLLAVLLLLAFPNVRQERLLIAAAERYQPHEAFEPDGVYGGIPYRVADDGSIEAIMQGSLIRFRDVDRFTGALQP